MSGDEEKKGTQEKELGPVSRTLERIIEIFEKDRFTPLTAFAFLIAVGVIRSVSESLLFEFERTFSIYLVAQHTAFNFPVLIMGTLILSLASGTSLRKVYNAVIPGFAIVTLPPFFDLLLGQVGLEHAGLYSYHADGLTFVQKLGEIYPPNMLLADEISTGLRVMVVSIMILSGLYISIKVKIGESLFHLKERKFRPILKKISRLFFGVFGIWIVVWFIVAIVPTAITLAGTELESRIIIFDYFTFYLRDLTEYYIFIAEMGYDNVGFLAELMILQQRSLYIIMFFFSLSTIMMILSMYLKYPSLLKKIFSALKITIVLPLTVSALLGSAVLHLNDPNFVEGWALDPTYVLHFTYVFYIGAIGFFLGTFGSFVLDYYKEKNILSEKVSKHMAIVSLLAGGSFAFLMGPVRISLIFIPATILVYGTFRLKQRDLDHISTITYSAACFTVYFLGIFSPTVWKTKQEAAGGDGLTTLNIPRRPELTMELIGVGVIVLLLVLAGGLIKYLLEEDLLSEWMSSSNQIIPLLLIATAMLPGFIFNDIVHLLVFSSLGVGSAILTDEDMPFTHVIVISLILSYIIIDLWGLVPSL